MADAKQGGGCVLDESHAIDYMRWLCGEITEVSAIVDHVSSLEITTDDIADLTVRFASGTVGNIHMNLFAWNVHSHFELMGEEGVIQWRRFENEIRLFDPKANRWEIYPFGLPAQRHVHRRGEALSRLHPRGDGAGLRRLGRAQDHARDRRRREVVRGAALGAGLGRMAVTPYAFGVIPARGGSKGLPGKNLRKLGALSLIGHAVASAKEAALLTRFIVSTDSEEIAEEARRHGAEVPFLRPAALASDQAGMLRGAPARGALARVLGGGAPRRHRDPPAHLAVPHGHGDRRDHPEGDRDGRGLRADSRPRRPITRIS